MRSVRRDPLSGPAVAMPSYQAVAVENAGDQVVAGDQHQLPTGRNDTGGSVVALSASPLRRAKFGMGAANPMDQQADLKGFIDIGDHLVKGGNAALSHFVGEVLLRMCWVRTYLIRFVLMDIMACRPKFTKSRLPTLHGLWTRPNSLDAYFQEHGMEEKLGEILKFARLLGKSPDKTYLFLSSSQQNDAALQYKKERRQCHAKSRLSILDLSQLVQMEASRAFHCVCHVAMINDDLVDHCFCVVGYYPHADSPKCVQDIPLDHRCSAAWVIDPWLNITCRLDTYPQQVKKKLRKWTTQGKYILRKEEGLPEESLVVHDPYDGPFRSRFFTSPLQFCFPVEPALPQRRFKTMKATRREI